MTGTDRAILMADVTGSTPLYERHGDEVASQLVFDCVAGMQRIAHEEDGEFVRSKGDDVLCLFEDADRASRAAGRILEHGAAGQVRVHGGLHWGHVLWRGEELFGGAVNVAARLASSARENEFLLSSDLAARMTPHAAEILRPMGELSLKGTTGATGIFALHAKGPEGDNGLGEETVVSPPPQKRPGGGTRVSLVAGDWNGDIGEGEEITIGRAPKCSLVIPVPWVSRVHAVVNVRGGLVELKDQSAAGCTLRFEGAAGYVLHRQTVALTGTGVIALGTKAMQDDRPLIAFDVHND